MYCLVVLPIYAWLTDQWAFRCPLSPPHISSSREVHLEESMSWAPLLLLLLVLASIEVACQSPCVWHIHQKHKYQPLSSPVGNKITSSVDACKQECINQGGFCNLVEFLIASVSGLWLPVNVWRHVSLIDCKQKNTMQQCLPQVARQMAP